MNLIETLTGIFGLFIGAVTIAMGFMDNLPSGLMIRRIPPEQFRARHVLSGIGMVLLGLIIITHGLGYLT